MKEQFGFENPYRELINNHVLVYVQEADAQGKDMGIYVRGRVLAVEKDGLKIEFEGNENMLFDGQVDIVPVTYLATRLPKDNEPQGMPVVIVEEKGEHLYDEDGKVVSPGKWMEIEGQD